MTAEDGQNQAPATLVKVYPIVLILIAVIIDVLVIKVAPVIVALPSRDAIAALTVSASLLLLNHTWLMTTTELTRVRFNLFATPEESEASGRGGEKSPKEGVAELERRHNAHRNATENTVYFVLLAATLVLVSPPSLALWLWVVGFAVARLGHTYSYLGRRTGARGVFMSLSLLSLYGMAAYLVMSLFAE